MLLIWVSWARLLRYLAIWIILFLILGAECSEDGSAHHYSIQKTSNIARNQLMIWWRIWTLLMNSNKNWRKCLTLSGWSTESTILQINKECRHFITKTLLWVDSKILWLCLVNWRKWSHSSKSLMGAGIHLIAKDCISWLHLRELILTKSLTKLSNQKVPKNQNLIYKKPLKLIM